MKKTYLKKICTWAIVTLAFFTIASKSALAIPVIMHQGSNDPSTEGWTLDNAGSLGTLVGGTEITTSGSHDYWRIEDADTSGVHRYIYSPSASDLSGDWYFEASVRVTNGPTVPGRVNLPPNAVFVSDGLNVWSFYLGDSIAGLENNNVPSELTLSTSIDFSDYHTFGIQFSQNGVGVADDKADFFIDGSLVFNDVGRSGLSTSSSSLIYFGPVGTASVGDARYESILFDDGAAPVPVPSAILLFGSGLLCLVSSRL